MAGLSVSVTKRTVRRAVRATGRCLGVSLYQATVALGITATLVSFGGCYKSVPTTFDGLQPNTTIVADVNDVGRVSLGQNAGPEVARLEGKVVQKSDTAARVLVSSIWYLNGTESAWQGQELMLRNLDIKSVTQRSFSRSRTTTAIIGLAAVAAVVIAKTGFVGFLSGEQEGKKNPPPPEQ